MCIRDSSIAQIINSHRKCNYRDHRNKFKPPLQGRGIYTRRAQQADLLVKHSLNIISWAVDTFNTAWALENPRGFLAHRPFMRNLKARLPHQLHLVDYCAFLGRYMKPTHIWTNIKWIPRGTTLTGRCCQKCQGGKRNSKNRWVHKFALATHSP